ncbi:hypothetical protein NZL82_13170 [Sphingomonas sanguinis]|uniref:hypothetical protein n=1 Tax=Sphingomonas sp. LC-1 TaxID=3110957 RepID=UPI0021BBAB3E|nr:hypothetical protein [Sphingomonas sp. LC-1]MCT8002825.1 hypothetical protein [Sphingomonas sp. LC-1]
MRSMLSPVAAALLTAASPAPTPCSRNLGEVRIRQILAPIREKVARQGVNPDVAEATFRAMVEGFTAEEAW